MSAGATMTALDGRAVPLRSVAFEGTVSGAHARARVRQTYVNQERAPVEAVYTFPLPADAVLTAFSLRCGGRVLRGAVREREDAFHAYDVAISRGHGAALVEQERSNAFTVQVGNLLPGEETTVELEYLQRLAADEGALRWTIPTLVAPRYVPGTPGGDRTGHGTADPTDRVKDADRVTPPSGDARYQAELEVWFDLGHPVEVESPSHPVAVEPGEGERVRVRFAGGTAALDRDIVLTARSRTEQMLAMVRAHRVGPTGTFALSVVPDLFVPGPPERHDVVFVVDVSGSMAGEALDQARAALRLCLRHLREGDRFGLIAFQSTFTTYAPELRPFTQPELEKADAFVAGLAAAGGTEMLEPLLAALQMAPDATVVLLTDGQVANEDEILARVLERRGRARVLSFGIGTNVSDALLLELGRRSGGGTEWIHPGERLDEKVVAQFARVVAPRVEEMAVAVEGVEAAELSPEPLPALVDGQVWSLLGRYHQPGRGRLRVT
ncbi:MAG TPA: VIT domain-containing protein, partial [Myxococcales bacterium]|nr:VIT domain-containing protein [Myxococcales bacterium]